MHVVALKDDDTSKQRLPESNPRRVEQNIETKVQGKKDYKMEEGEEKHQKRTPNRERAMGNMKEDQQEIL